MCMVRVCCHGTHVEVRGQFSGVSYTFLSLRVLGIERRLSSLTATVLLCFLWLHGNWTRQCDLESLSSASVECESHPCCWLIVQHCTHIYFMADNLLCSSLGIFGTGCCGFRLLADIHVGCVWCSAVRPACSMWVQQALLWPPAPSMLSLLHPDQSGGSVVPSHVYQHLLTADKMPSPLDICLPREDPVSVFGYWPDLSDYNRHIKPSDKCKCWKYLLLRGFTKWFGVLLSGPIGVL